jgi:hypothetical protein
MALGGLCHSMREIAQKRRQMAIVCLKRTPGSCVDPPVLSIQASLHWSIGPQVTIGRDV